MALALAGAALSGSLAACGGTTLACDRIPDVAPGVCITDEADRVAAPEFPSEFVPVENPATFAGEALPEPILLSEVQGSVVVVNLWGSWCGPCRREQPELNEVAAAFADQGVVFVGVDVRDTQAGASGHAREFEIPYGSWFDPTQLYPSLFDASVPRSVPATVIIDRDGRIATTINSVTTGPELTMLLNIVLSEGPNQ